MGFTKEVLRAGGGTLPTRGQRVTVHCTGFGKNGDMVLEARLAQTAANLAVGVGAQVLEHQGPGPEALRV